MADNKRVALLPIGMEKQRIVGADFHPLATIPTLENVRFEGHEVSIRQGSESVKNWKEGDLMASDIFTVWKKDKETHAFIGKHLYHGSNQQDAERAARGAYPNPVEVQGVNLDVTHTAGGYENDPPDGTYTVINWME